MESFPSDPAEYGSETLACMARDIRSKPDKQHQGPIRAIASALIHAELKKRHFDPETAAETAQLKKARFYKGTGGVEVTILVDEVDRVEHDEKVDGGCSSMSHHWIDIYWSKVYMKDGTVYLVKEAAGTLRSQLGID